MPRVSIVIASYNRAALLSQCLGAIESQTFEDWECFVCDDGSQDDTHAVVNSLADRDPRFRLSQGARFGLPAGPRNRGIALARGEWIAFVDDDDLWHPLKLERQIEVVEAHAPDAVATNLVMFGGDQPIPEWQPHTSSEPIGSLSLEGIVRRRVPFPSTPTNLIRRNLLLQVGGFSEHAAYRALEDYDLWARLMALPSFRWVIVGGPPLVAARFAGSDSISSWRRIPKPEFLRQQFAILEIFARIVAAERAALRSVLPQLRAELLQMVDDCAHRSRLLGWRRQSIALYQLAAAMAGANGDQMGAANRLLRAVRFGLFGKVDEPAPLDIGVPLLVERIKRFLAIIRADDTLRVDPLAIGPDGAWSHLSRAVSVPAQHAIGPLELDSARERARTPAAPHETRDSSNPRI